MSTTMTLDWQTGVTLAIGLVALVYLLRRWWPSWRGWSHAPAATPTACQAEDGGVSAPTAACGSGCGNCGAAHMPRRDHRVTVQRHPQG